MSRRTQCTDPQLPLLRIGCCPCTQRTAADPYGTGYKSSLASPRVTNGAVEKCSAILPIAIRVLVMVGQAGCGKVP